MENTFYMVYVQDQEAPVFKHNSLEAAEEEAKRLATFLKKKAFILCSLKAFELNIFKESDLRPSNDLPF